MILLTVGTELPFDRLVSAVDAWAGESPDVEVVAQIGESSYQARNFATRRFIDPEEYTVILNRCAIVVAHAGMGVILNALSERRPIVVMPRLSKLGEHRNDHQVATAEAFEKRGFVRVAHDGHQVAGLLKDPCSYVQEHSIPSTASPSLVEALRSFIHA